MHIEPGVVTGAKLALSYATAAAVGGYLVKSSFEAMREKGLVSFAARGAMATAAVLFAFEALPHPPVGLSEVHFIFGSTLFLLLGAAPSALGLALGLLLQGVIFEPQDLPQYAMNVTTLLAPLFLLQGLASRIIAPDTAYVDVGYRQALALSTAFQAGVVGWVAFWVCYGNGVSLASLESLALFAAAYAPVVVLEATADLAILGMAKSLRGMKGSALVTPRLYHAA